MIIRLDALELPGMPRIRPLLVSVARIMGSSGQVASGRISRDRGDGIVWGRPATQTSCADTCGQRRSAPLPVRRLAVARSQTADTVFRKILRQPRFTWAGHGQAVQRKRKP